MASIKEEQMRATISGFLLFLGICNVDASAAEFTVQKHVGCAVFMTGELQAGDGEKFRKVATSLGLLEGKPGDYVYNETEKAICLRSPGGAWVEGRTIAELVSEFGITTRVLDGDDCLSACSLVFMAGRFRGAEFDGPSRYLHVRGRLGFHGPYLLPPESRSYSASEIHDVSVMQNMLIADFIKFGSSGYAYSYRGSVAMSLVGDMLARGPRDMIFADTVEGVARWNIYLEGVKNSIRLDKNRMFQACENALNFPFDRPARTITPETYQHEPDLEINYLTSSQSNPKVFGQVQFSGDANKTCLIQMNDDGGLAINMEVTGISICSDNGETGISSGKCPDFPDYLPIYYAMPPDAPISSLSE